VFKTREPEVLLSGPAGTGKSRACLEKLHAVALKYPGMHGLIVRKTATSLATTALVTWREHVILEALSGLVNYYGGSAVEPAQYQYQNGSLVMIGGMDKATRIMSSEYDVVYIQEAIELSVGDWEALTTRLRHGKIPYQQIIADTNPDVPTHWLHERASAGQTRMIETRHRDNPVLYADTGELTEAGRAYLHRLDGLTGPRRLRLRDGRWVAAEGVVYEEWDAAIHLVDHFPIPADWTRLWAVDFGYTNPFVLQCWAEDDDGRLFRYRELYLTGRTVDQHAADILACVAPDGVWTEPKPEAIICDHDAENRAQLVKHLGLGTTAANKKVLEGIQAVQVRLRERRLFLLRGSLVRRDESLAEGHRPTCTEEELPGYIWDTRKEAPVKVDDHGSDALRYLVAHRDLGGGVRVRWLGG